MSKNVMRYSGARDLEIKFAMLQEIHAHVELGAVGISTFEYYFI